MLEGGAEVLAVVGDAAGIEGKDGLALPGFQLGAEGVEKMLGPLQLIEAQRDADDVIVGERR